MSKWATRRNEIINYCRLGANDAQLAKILDLTLAEFEDLMVLDEDFSDAVDFGRDFKRTKGRPTKWDPSRHDDLFKYLLLGATNKQVADYLGITESTVGDWLANDPEFRATMRAGREGADEQVAHSLFRRAIGYTIDEEKLFHHQGYVTRAPVVTEVQPDVGAQKLWLLNRQRKDWGGEQKQEHEIKELPKIRLRRKSHED